MKCILILVFTGLFVLSVVANAQAAGCSNASVKGSFGFILTGTRIGGSDPGPRANVGRFTSDGKGNLSGYETKSKNGTIILDVTITGTYTVNPDCTGSTTITGSDGEVRNFDFVIVNKHSEVFGIQIDDGRVTTFNAKK